MLKFKLVCYTMSPSDDAPDTNLGWYFVLQWLLIVSGRALMKWENISERKEEVPRLVSSVYCCELVAPFEFCPDKKNVHFRSWQLGINFPIN